MKKTRFIIAAIAGLFLFVACERNDFEPFAGKDNFIVSFTLKQGETTLDASIEEGVIRVSVPEGLSLEGAKAEIRLSEHASVKPDPTKISAWNEDHQFAVTSFGGKQRSYVYTVSRTRIETEGTVLLGTQAEVDAFGQLGTAAVKGNLIIGRLGGSDSIVSLLPLASLKEVDYALTINPTYKGADLDGLESLERVGDLLQIGACPHLETVVLPSLERIGGISIENSSTVVVNLPALTRAEGALTLACPLYQMNLAALKEARDITLRYSVNAAGATLVEVSLPALETADNVSISFLANVSKIDLPELRTVGNLSLGSLVRAAFVFAPRLESTANLSVAGMPALTEIEFPALVKTQNLTLNQPSLLIIDFPKLAQVALLTVTETRTGGFAPFPALKTADGIVFYYFNTMLDIKTLTIPASVERIGMLSFETRKETVDEIDIRGGKVGELRVLATAIRCKIRGDEVFDGTIVFNNGSAEQPYPDFPELDGFAEVDSLVVNGMFESIHLKGIRKLNKSFSLGSGGSIPAASMPDLEEIGGTLKLFPFYNFTLEAVSAPKLKRVGGDFIANEPGSFISRVDFPALETVGGNCNINTGMSLYDRQIEALLFPKLTSIGGTLTIQRGSYTNTVLKNFDGFAALRTVKAISVTGQMGVESFDGLKPAVRNLRPEDWSASGNAINPSYEDMTR